MAHAIGSRCVSRWATRGRPHWWCQDAPCKASARILVRKAAAWNQTAVRALAYASGSTASEKSGASQGATDSGGLAAHLSYDPSRVDDMATLVLMARSACASEYLDAFFWRACSWQAQKLMASSSFDQIARFIQAAAQTRFRDDELMYNVGDFAAEGISRLEADALAAILHAHELLAFRNDRVLRKLEMALLHLMHESRATSSGLSLALRSLARLFDAGVIKRPPQELLDGVARMVAEHIGFFSVQELCEVLEAYGAYRIQGDRQASNMLSSIAKVFSGAKASLSAEHCAVAARTFAKCRVHDERLLVTLGNRLRNKEVRESLTTEGVTHVLYGLAKFTCQDTALLDLLSIEARRHLHKMDATLMSASLSSLAKAGVSSPVLTSRAAVQLRRATPESWDQVPMRDIENLAMAFGKLQQRDDKLFGTIADAVLRKPSTVLMTEPCSALVNLTHAFTKVHSPHPALFKAITRALYERFEELPPPDVVKLLHAVAKVDMQLSVGLQECISQALRPEVVEQFGVFELLKLSTALRRLRIEVPALEAQIGAVLPNEVRGQESLGGPRRPTPPPRRRKSIRRQKWTW